MVARSRLKRNKPAPKGALAMAMGDYKMDMPNSKIEPMLKDLPSLKDLD